MRLASPLLLLALAACGGVDPATPIEDHYFSAQGPTESRLLWLRKDGSFGLYWRTHLTCEEVLRGRWHPEPGGVFALRGPWQRYVRHRSMTLIGRAEQGGFRDLRKTLAGLLQAEPNRRSFPAGLLAEATEWHGRSERDGSVDRWVAQNVFVTGDSVSREELQGAIAAIDRHPGSRPADEVRAWLHRAGDREFLHWPEGGPQWREETAEELIDIVRENATPEAASIFVRITPVEFEAAVRR